MEDPTHREDLAIQFVGAEHRVRAGLSGKRERPLPVLVEPDKCQRRKLLRIPDHRPGPDALFFQRFNKEPAVHVVSDFPDKCRLISEVAHGGKKISRCPARILLEKLHAVAAFS